MRKCRYCKAELPPKKDSDRWQAAGFCNVDHMAQHGLAKAREQRARKQKRDIAERRQRIKTKAERLNELQAIVNKYIRIRDMGKPCISCGRPDDGLHQRHASHYRSRGANSNLRFHTLNIHSSCAKCNNFESGNIVEYRIGLKKRYGDWLPEWLESQDRSRRFDDDWIERAKKVFRKKCRRATGKVRNLTPNRK